jgi:hypothetical protein
VTTRTLKAPAKATAPTKSAPAKLSPTQAARAAVKATKATKATEAPAPVSAPAEAEVCPTCGRKIVNADVAAARSAAANTAWATRRARAEAAAASK